MAQNNVNGFTVNAGQMKDTDGALRSDLLYTANAAGAKIYLRQTGISFCYYKNEEDTLLKDSAARFDMNFNSSSSQLQVVGEDILSNKSNFFIGSVAFPNVNEYGKVVYQNLWSNIDLVVSIDENGFNFSYNLKKGANPTDIKIDYVGTKSLNPNAKSTLVNLPFGNLLNVTNYSIKQLNPTKNKPTISSSINSSKLSQLSVGNYSSSSEYEISQAVVAPNAAPVPPPSTTNKWSTYYGGSLDDEVTDVYVHTDSSILVTGVTTSTNFPRSLLPYDNTYDGLGDIFVIKFNKNRERLFATFINGSDQDISSQIACNSLGEIYFVGNTKSSNYFILGSGSEYRRSRGANALGRPIGFITKMNANGSAITWSSYVNANEYIIMNGLAITSDNKVYVSGFREGIHGAESNATQTNGSAYHQSNASVVGKFPGYFSRFTSGHVQDWASYFGGTQNTFLSSCAVDQNNNFIILGTTTNTGSASCGVLTNGNLPICGATNAYKQFNNGGARDFIITKFNTNGIITWSTLYGGTGSENQENYFLPNSLTTDENGDIYVVGSTTGNIPGPSSYSGQTTYGGGLSDGILLRFGSVGNPKFATYIGGDNTDVATCVKTYPEYGYAVGGNTMSSNFPIFPRTDSYFDGSLGGSQDGFLSEYTVSNSKFLATYFGGTSNETLNTIGIGKNGTSIVMGGKTNSDDYDYEDPAGSLDYTDISANGLNDGFVADLFYYCGNICRTIGDEDRIASTFKMYPNPTNNLLTVDLGSLANNAQISIINYTGQLVLDQKIEAGISKKEFDCSNLSKGVYLVTLLNNNTTSSLKLIIQ